MRTINSWSFKHWLFVKVLRVVLKGTVSRWLHLSDYMKSGWLTVHMENVVMGVVRLCSPFLFSYSSNWEAGEIEMHGHAQDWSELGRRPRIALLPHSLHGCASRLLQFLNYCGREKKGTVCSLGSCLLPVLNRYWNKEGEISCVMCNWYRCIPFPVIYSISEDFQLDFLAMYSCVGLWNAFFLLLYSFFGLSKLMKWSTRWGQPCSIVCG